MSFIKERSFNVKYLIVGFGGLLGSSLRLLVSFLYIQAGDDLLPLSTLTVNLIGAFCLSYLYGKSCELSERTLLFLATGLLGSFTTFSTFSLEMLEMVKEGTLLLVGIYLIISILGGLLSAYSGYLFSRRGGKA